MPFRLCLFRDLKEVGRTRHSAGDRLADLQKAIAAAGTKRATEISRPHCKPNRSLCAICCCATVRALHLSCAMARLRNPD